MSKLHFTGHQYYLDEDYRIYTYYDTNKEKIYKHTHDFYEMYRLISGHVKYSTAGNSFYLKPGDFLFINKHQEHFPEVMDFSQPYDKPEAYGRKILGRSLLASLFVLLTQHMDTPSVYSFDKSDKNIQIISVTEQYIRNHIEEKILIEDLADYLFMNKYYFMHQFKEISGVPVYQFIQKVRLEVLKEQIEGGSSLLVATERCGFGDYSNFYRYFKREFGCSPREYFQK